MKWPQHLIVCPGHGPRDDYEYVGRARKEHACAHIGPNSGRPLDVPYAGPIQIGQPYVRTRQSWLEWEPVNIACLLAARHLTHDTEDTESSE